MNIFKISLFITSLFCCTCFTVGGANATISSSEDVAKEFEITAKNSKVVTVVAVVDSSGSMSRTDPNNLRVSALKLMVDSLDNRYNFGLVDFDSKATVLAEPVQLGEYNGEIRNDLKDITNFINSDGGTDIRKGLELGCTLIPQDQMGVIVLLTDGHDKNWHGEMDMCSTGVIIHTIALSDNADIDGLTTISNKTEGIAEIARNANDLLRVFTLIFTEVHNDEVLLVEEKNIKQGEKSSTSISVERGQGALEFSLSKLDSEIEIQVQEPGGRIISIENAVSGGYGVKGETYDVMWIKKPLAGIWNVELFGKKITNNIKNYTLRVAGRNSSVKTNWEIYPKTPTVGDSCEFTITNHSGIVWHSIEVTWTDSNGNKQKKQIQPQKGVDATVQKIYSWNAKKPGVNHFNFVARGTLPNGDEIIRSLNRSIWVAVSSSNDAEYMLVDGVMVEIQKKIMPQKPKIYLVENEDTSDILELIRQSKMKKQAVIKRTMAN